MKKASGSLVKVTKNFQATIRQLEDSSSRFFRFLEKLFLTIFPLPILDFNKKSASWLLEIKGVEISYKINYRSTVENQVLYRGNFGLYFQPHLIWAYSGTIMIDQIYLELLFLMFTIIFWNSNTLIYVAVCSYQIMYAFQIESTL